MPDQTAAFSSTTKATYEARCAILNARAPLYDMYQHRLSTVISSKVVTLSTLTCKVRHAVTIGYQLRHGEWLSWWRVYNIWKRLSGKILDEPTANELPAKCVSGTVPGSTGEPAQTLPAFQGWLHTRPWCHLNYLDPTLVRGWVHLPNAWGPFASPGLLADHCCAETSPASNKMLVTTSPTESMGNRTETAILITACTPRWTSVLSHFNAYLFIYSRYI